MPLKNVLACEGRGEGLFKLYEAIGFQLKNDETPTKLDLLSTKSMFLVIPFNLISMGRTHLIPARQGRAISAECLVRKSIAFGSNGFVDETSPKMPMPVSRNSGYEAHRIICTPILTICDD